MENKINKLITDMLEEENSLDVLQKLYSVIEMMERSHIDSGVPEATLEIIEFNGRDSGLKEYLRSKTMFSKKNEEV